MLVLGFIELVIVPALSCFSSEFSHLRTGLLLVYYILLFSIVVVLFLFFGLVLYLVLDLVLVHLAKAYSWFSPGRVHNKVVWSWFRAVFLALSCA